VYTQGLIPLYIYPVFKVYLGISEKEIPNLALFAAAFIAFVLTPFVATMAKMSSKEGYDNTVMCLEVLSTGVSPLVQRFLCFFFFLLLELYA
jgi:hypothetical protein